MITTLPDNAINTELKARLHNMEVGGETFKFYVTNVTSAKVKNYFLVGTQLNLPKHTNCGVGWFNETVIQVVTIYPKNTGSKALMNDATNDVIQELEDFSLPVLTGLIVSLVTLDIENELIEDTASEVVYRKIIRMKTTIT